MTLRNTALVCLGIAGFGLALYYARPVEPVPEPQAPVMTTAPAQQPRWFSSVPPATGSQAFPLPSAAPATTVNGRNGRAVNLGGKTVAEYVSARIGKARSGDAAAAYEVYQAESICAANEDPVADYHDPAEKEAFLRERQARIKLCAGVSPAQVQERLGFLDAAARAGNIHAQVDYYMEGPYGRDFDIADNANDPTVKKWKEDAVAYLKQAGDKCDHFSLALLSNVYDAGTLTPRDLKTSMGYAIAAAVPRKTPLTEEQLRSRFGDELSAADFDSARQLGAQLASQACPAKPQ